MRIIFQNSRGQKRVIEEDTPSDETAFDKINSFCEERGFKISYVRCWEGEDGKSTIVDVGSWTELFILER